MRAMRVIAATMNQVRELTLKLVFALWRGLMVETERAALRSEVNRMTELLGRQGTSIWDMKKQELIEVARRELEMPPHVAQKLTVMVLREKIRATRKDREAIEHSEPSGHIQEIDSLPKGLEKMTSEQLVEECTKRGISTHTTERGRNAIKSRPRMIVAIKDYVAASTTTAAVPPAATRTRSASVKRRADPLPDDSTPMQP